MKHFNNKLISEYPLTEHHDIEIYSKYLYNKLFRGFYYDSEDKSYGIILSFLKGNTDSLNLYAQESKSGTVTLDYRIHTDIFTLDQLAYDKVLISATSFDREVLIPEKGSLDFPKIVEFTIQVLTRNSIYLRFLNHELFTPPISSFQGGLVLSREHHSTKKNKSKLEVEAGELF